MKEQAEKLGLKPGDSPAAKASIVEFMPIGSEWSGFDTGRSDKGNNFNNKVTCRIENAVGDKVQAKLHNFKGDFTDMYSFEHDSLNVTRHDGTTATGKVSMDLFQYTFTVKGSTGRNFVVTRTLRRSK